MTIVIAKKAEVTEFHPYVSVMKYLHDKENTCCFSILEYAMFSYGEYATEKANA